MLERLFHLKANGTCLRNEIVAGATTFMAAAYIIFVHPDMLAATGMDKGALTTVTCLVAGLASLLMALWANVPIMMAPGMGLNAFFTYTLVINQHIPWQTALGIVFLSGIIFLLLTWLGFRERILKAIPVSLQLATAVGIGLFIAFIGLQKLGLIVDNPATLVGLGPITRPVLLGLIGLLLAVFLEIRRVRGALLFSILTVTALAFFSGEAQLPDSLVAMPPSPAPIAFKLDILGALNLSFWAAVFTFMFMDLFDSLGTLLAVCREAGMVKKDGKIPGLPRMLSADALATVGGAVLGTSTTTAFLESASGVSDGGRTGLTSVVTGLLFLLSAFFAPLVGAVPACATAPALIMVGIFMMRGMGQIDFYDFEEGAPAFLTILFMPLTYSISNGLAFGFLSYALIKILLGKWRQCDPFLLGAALLSLISLCL
ncbi:adenine transport membrane protein [Syntrophotalea carbinolica DSM 2380]|uniref:Adenine transport membrane protein n=1 Tax=Syntrophotalea carbinolica (strain DSM 2380 / NBRC 103641 / GraBd1) TaxID=338963 RepID=Q3A5W3_SYNC1|nr:NCS2 family permease [Syntrophotalea carbinolica]ABA88244.1 adenine transport membrane protein [Syntrophotalea carbinolica DSM 2380]